MKVKACQAFASGSRERRQGSPKGTAVKLRGLCWELVAFNISRGKRGGGKRTGGERRSGKINENRRGGYILWTDGLGCCASQTWRGPVGYLRVGSMKRLYVCLSVHRGC